MSSNDICVSSFSSCDRPANDQKACALLQGLEAGLDRGALVSFDTLLLCLR